MARLKVHVHVVDKNNDVHVFGPDDDVPAWAQKAITNDDVWDEAPAAPRASSSRGGSRKTNAGKAATADDESKDEADASAYTEEQSGDDAAAPRIKPAPGEAFSADTAGDEK